MNPSTLVQALRPFESTPHLTLDLVLDRAPSMELWTRTVDDLRAALGRAPFQKLRVRTVDTSAPGEPAAADTGVPRPGGQVVLLVSNCVEDAWQDGRAVALLDHWCRTSATAVLQPLPPSLRHRVRVPLAPFRWRAPRPATPTAWLECGLQPGSLEEAAGLRAPGAVPVLDPADSRSVEAWARLVAAPTTDWYEGDGIPTPGPGTPDGFAMPVPRTEPADLVQTLRDVAGPAAVRLAALLAVAPLVTLDLLHAVRRGLLPEADEAVPEVFHSGLLVRAPDRDRDLAGQHAFVLLDGAAELLTEELTRSDMRRALDLAVELLPPAAWARNMRRAPSSALRAEPVRPAPPTRRDGPDLPVVRSALPARNPRFVGRGELLDTIDATLRRPGGDGLCVLHGIAGVGKTQAALEYAHRHRGAYDFVWWSQARDARNLALSLARLGDELSVPPGPDGLAPVDGVLDRLRSGRVDRGWLLVLDNADPPAGLTPLLPLGAGHILITSRHVSWTEETAHPLRVAPLSRPESLALLRTRAPWLTDDQASAVAERAGDLPPLLIHLGRSLSKGPLDVAEHLDGFDRLCAGLLLNYGLPDYDVKLAAVWQRAVAELGDADGAAELLRVLSCLGTGPVSYGLLSAATEPSPATGDGGVLHDKYVLHLALLRLADEDLATVEVQGGPVEVHPALQMVMRGVVMTANDYRTAQEAVLRLLTAALPADPATPSGRVRMTEIARRLDLPAALRMPPAAAYRLVTAVIEHHAAVGDSRAAGGLARAALKVWSGRFGADDRSVAVLRAHAGPPSRDP
ncbi:FxSxx-COOH system tetratricopeptide repeat protein [Streptomyces fuscichromogenes]|uniref:FxSxx-COOH system tetratricopeptide repeat protein n=1 Tax=Streptomyces fuscichromogenes TaxID=1324013 RepID=UPI00382B64B5